MNPFSRRQSVIVISSGAAELCAAAAVAEHLLRTKTVLEFFGLETQAKI